MDSRAGGRNFDYVGVSPFVNSNTDRPTVYYILWKNVSLKSKQKKKLNCLGKTKCVHQPPSIFSSLVYNNLMLSILFSHWFRAFARFLLFFSVFFFSWKNNIVISVRNFTNLTTFNAENENFRLCLKLLNEH